MPIGLMGATTPRLDEKGRLFLPARYREDFVAGVVITKGHENTLHVYRSVDFEQRYRDFQARDDGSLEARNFARSFFGSAYEQQPDRNGRVTVPANLRTYAGIDRDIALVGVGAYFEMWDRATFEAAEADADRAVARPSEVGPRF